MMMTANCMTSLECSKHGKFSQELTSLEGIVNLSSLGGLSRELTSLGCMMFILKYPRS